MSTDSSDDIHPIFTEKAPLAIGPYSQAMVVGPMVFTSGQLALDPANPDDGLVEGGVERQTERVIQNLAAVLEAAGSGLEQVVKTTCFLTTMDDFSLFNTVYARYFPQKPSRSCVAVKQLPRNALVEIEAIALLKT